MFIIPTSKNVAKKESINEISEQIVNQNVLGSPAFGVIQSHSHKSEGVSDGSSDPGVNQDASDMRTALNNNTSAITGTQRNRDTQLASLKNPDYLENLRNRLLGEVQPHPGQRQDPNEHTNKSQISKTPTPGLHHRENGLPIWAINDTVAGRMLNQQIRKVSTEPLNVLPNILSPSEPHEDLLEWQEREPILMTERGNPWGKANIDPVYLWRPAKTGKKMTFGEWNGGLRYNGKSIAIASSRPVLFLGKEGREAEEKWMKEKEERVQSEKELASLKRRRSDDGEEGHTDERCIVSVGRMSQFPDGQ